MKAAVIAALAIPVLCASAQDYKADYTISAQQADAWQAGFRKVEQELQALGVDLAAPAAPAGLPETDDTVAVADQGLFFDTANSALVYLGNVRLRDPRAHFNATGQLHIYLQDLPGSKDDETQPADTVKKAASYGVPSTAKPTAAEAPAAAPAPATPEAADETPAEPAIINTHCAVADSVNNQVFLYSPAGGQEILMQQGENIVRITPSAESPARILADPQGNIMLEGSLVDLCLVDKDGSITKLKSTGGLVYYHAATHTLHAPGSADFTHPSGALRCTDGLCIVFTPSADQPKETKGFMSQFTGLRFDGIDTATARGQVVMTGEAVDGRPAMQAEGDTLTYNGKTGECALQGTQSRLKYGAYEVYSNEALNLLANGDIELRGSDIHGSYERESDTPGQMLQGTFKANAHIIFRAETGTISTEKGLTLADAEADFSCTGPVHLVLSPKEGAEVPEPRPGMPNLAITRYGDIRRLQATGDVTAHRYEPATRRCTTELKAHSVHSDLETGETILTGEAGQPLVARQEGNSIISTPAAGETATMELLANGDLRLSGATISATMVNEDGKTTASCKDYVRLIRAENRLETGSATRLQAPDAILTTNGSLNAILTSTKKADDAPAKPGFSSFRFDFDGIREAHTAKGGTIRTEQGSMQCTGPVRIVMADAGQQKDSQLSGIKTATASGNVALAGKDNSGRLLVATGDHLSVNAITGMKVLSGNRVTLSDEHNTHIITGKDAAVRIDAKNNVKISGSSHKTHASNVREQLKTTKTPKSKN